MEEIFPVLDNPLTSIRSRLEDGLVRLIDLSDSIEAGDYFLFTYDEELCVPVGESIRSISTPLGQAHLYVRSNGTTRPEKVTFFTPSQRIFRDSAKLLRGTHLSHLAPALHLLGFQIAEVDK